MGAHVPQRAPAPTPVHPCGARRRRPVPQTRRGPLRIMDCYDLGETLGEGTYGSVKAATHKVTGRRVAIKRVRGGGDRDGVCIPALREIKALKEVRSRGRSRAHTACMRTHRRAAPPGGCRLGQQALRTQVPRGRRGRHSGVGGAAVSLPPTRPPPRPRSWPARAWCS
jgi:hypothetical protein